MGGFVIVYCNGAIDWSAGNLKLVPDSSHEAEAAQASRAAKAAIYVRQLLLNNGRKVVIQSFLRLEFQDGTRIGSGPRTR